jgi:hypothetical protein
MQPIGLVVAAIALILHGVIEVSPILFQRRLSGAGSKSWQGPEFIFKPLQANLKVTTAVGYIFGAVRIIAAVAILFNLLWGWWLGIIISVVTYVILTIFLPMGIFDGIFSGIALVGLLIGYFGSQVIK